MADNAPRLAAFHGGPFGIGWAPWAIGVGALALGIFFFMRRGGAAGGLGPQAQGAGLAPGQRLGSLPYPYPSAAPSDGGLPTLPPIPPPNPAPTPNPSAQQLQTATLRAANPALFSGWDIAHQGIPAGSGPAGTPWSGLLLPYQSSWQVAGPPQGQSIPLIGPGGSKVFVNAQDIASYVGSNPSATQLASMGGQVNVAA